MRRTIQELQDEINILRDRINDIYAQENELSAELSAIESNLDGRLRNLRDDLGALEQLKIEYGDDKVALKRILRAIGNYHYRQQPEEEQIRQRREFLNYLNTPMEEDE